MDILSSLNLKQLNQGGCTDENNWLGDAGLITSTNPWNNQEIGSVSLCDEGDYETIIQSSQKAYLHWRTVPAPKRGEVIRALGDLLRKHKDALGSLVSMEMGKPKQEGDGEVQEMIDMADFAVGQSRMLYGNTMHSERPSHRMYEQWHPLGPVGVVSAFNFPVAVWAWNAFIAAICGDTVIWKPSGKTPLCAIAVQHLCNHVMAEYNCPGVFSLFISQNRKLSKKMIADSRLPLISFTGSTQVGQDVSKTVAERFGRSILELSGNNAMIVDNTADLDLAIPAIVFGAVGTAGQRCTSTRRLFLHDNIYSETIDRLKQAYQQITPDLTGPLIDQHAIEDFSKAITQAKQQGGEILFGGDVINQPGNFVQPTIITAENQWDIVQTETFGPILYIIKIESVEQGIELQNKSCHGLSSALFSKNLNNTELFLSCLGSDCGIANINIGTSGAEIGGAFGGEKATGGGREAGSDAWKAYMRRQTNTINYSDDLPLAQGIDFKWQK